MKLFYENIKAVIFDFDGTLYDNSKVALNLIKASPLSMFKMKKDREARKILKGEYFVTEEEYLKAYDFYVSSKWHMEKYLPLMIKVFQKKYKAHPNVEQVFQILRKNGVKTIILSDYARIQERMRAVGLSPSIADYTFSSQELGGLKPAKEVFMAAARFSGVSVENILVVGDRIDTDGEGARVCGMKFIQIKTKKNEKNPPSEIPFFKWHEFADLVMKE